MGKCTPEEICKNGRCLDPCGGKCTPDQVCEKRKCVNNKNDGGKQKEDTKLGDNKPGGNKPGNKKPLVGGGQGGGRGKKKKKGGLDIKLPKIDDPKDDKPVFPPRKPPIVDPTNQNPPAKPQGGKKGKKRKCKKGLIGQIACLLKKVGKFAKENKEEIATGIAVVGAAKAMQFRRQHSTLSRHFSFRPAPNNEAPKKNIPVPGKKASKGRAKKVAAGDTDAQFVCKLVNCGNKCGKDKKCVDEECVDMCENKCTEPPLDVCSPKGVCTDACDGKCKPPKNKCNAGGEIGFCTDVCNDMCQEPQKCLDDGTCSDACGGKCKGSTVCTPSGKCEDADKADKVSRPTNPRNDISPQEMKDMKQTLDELNNAERVCPPVKTKDKPARKKPRGGGGGGGGGKKKKKRRTENKGES